jgi:hypothetical protein
VIVKINLNNIDVDNDHHHYIVNQQYLNNHLIIRIISHLDFIYYSYHDFFLNELDHVIGQHPLLRGPMRSHFRMRWRAWDVCDACAISSICATFSSFSCASWSRSHHLIMIIRHLNLKR